MTAKIELKPGDPAWLAEDDCFGTKVPVVVRKIHKGGNAKVVDTLTLEERECATARLSSRETQSGCPQPS